MKSRPEIVVLTPVKNEAWILDRFLAVSSCFADLILIADQHSTDDGADICARYEKVKLIQNPATDLNEAQRQQLLIETARKLCPGQKILLALDADEIMAADAMQSADWERMLQANPGTVLYFEKPDLLQGAEKCIRYPDDFQPLGFVDDETTVHLGRKIHSRRIPTDEHLPRLYLDGIKILHYGPARPRTQLAKNRYYSVQENLISSNPVSRRRAFYGMVQRKLQKKRGGDSVPMPESWTKGWEDKGIEMKRIQGDEDFHWQEVEVLRAFEKFGCRRFWLDDIWDFDWEECRQRGVQLGIAGLPQKPILGPSLVYQIAGRGIDSLRNIFVATGLAALKRKLRAERNTFFKGGKRRLFEFGVWLYSLVSPNAATPPANPKSIFILRNNDIGDLLVVTPLFQALKQLFPNSRIIVGTGSWNFEVLKNNPFVDAVIPINAPWHNQRVQPQGVIAALRYIFTSPEVGGMARLQCDAGIDVLGSGYGALLLMRAGIPFRLGVSGYAGGHSAAQLCVNFNENEHVGRSALRFAELLGAEDIPEHRPQIFLDVPVEENGSIVIAPGGGFEGKCWPVKEYKELARLLTGRKVVVVGGEKDIAAAAEMQEANPALENLAGKLSLRETFRVIAGARLVICNSSMAMHAAAAFRKPCIVLLGDRFPSATAHAAQWGYPETKVLGKDGGRFNIWTPDEVAQLVAAQLAK